MLISVLLALTPALSAPQDGVGWEVTYLGGARNPNSGAGPGGCSGGVGGSSPIQPAGPRPDPYSPGDTIPGSTPSSPATGAPTTQPSPASTIPASSSAPGAPMTGQGAIAPSASSTPLATPGLDLDGWELWWRFNREPYLEVSPWAAAPISGSDASAAELSRLTPGVVHGRIIPALLRALEEERSPVLQASILLTLARIGDPVSDELGQSDLARRLAGYLDDSNQRIAETACIGLGILGRPSSLPALASIALGSGEGSALVGGTGVPARQRAFATYGIGLLAQRSQNPDVRAYATHVLTQVLAVRSNSQPDEHVAAVIGLGRIDPSGRTTSYNDRLAESLIDALGSRREDIRTRAHVPQALGALGPYLSPELREDCVDLLFQTAKRRGESEVIREGCVLALGQLGDADEDALDVHIRRELMDLVKNGILQTRTYAMLALARVGTRTGSGEGDPRKGVREVQAFLLKRLGRAKSQDEAWNALALGVLARGMRDNDEIPATSLLMALREGLRGATSPSENAAYAIALGLARDTTSAQVLGALAQELDPETQALVAIGLGMTGSIEAVGPLRAIVQESAHQPATLEAASRALALLHDQGLMSELEGVGAQCDCIQTHQGMSLALGRSRNPRAVVPLLAILENRGAVDVERAYAAVGLGYLAEKDPIPWSADISVDVHYRANPATLTSASLGGILDLP